MKVLVYNGELDELVDDVRCGVHDGDVHGGDVHGGDVHGGDDDGDDDGGGGGDDDGGDDGGGVHDDVLLLHLLRSQPMNLLNSLRMAPQLQPMLQHFFLLALSLTQKD